MQPALVSSLTSLQSTALVSADAGHTREAGQAGGGGVRKGRVTTFDVEIFHNFFVHLDAVAGLPHARQRCLAVATEFSRIEHPLCASLGERA